MEQKVRQEYEAIRSFEKKAFRSACYAPFVSLFFTTQGRVLACCKNGSYVLGDVRTQRLPEIWNGGKITVLRKALADYRFGLGCQYCEWELSGGNYETSFPLLFDQFPVASTTPEWPSMIEFEGSNTCNFECIMCNPETSSSIRANRDGLPALPKAYSDQFFEDLRKFLPHLRRAKFLGGEPFLTNESNRIWEMMLEDRLSIPCHITTNGSQYTAKVKRVLEGLPVSLTVSLDGATKATMEKIRINSKFERVIENIHRFREYTRRQGTTFNLAFCLMRQNWHEFGDLLLFAEDLDCVVWVNTVADPSYCSLYTLPRHELAEIVEKLEEQGKALEDKLRVNRGVWHEALHKLRSATQNVQNEKMADVLSWYYLADDPLNKSWGLAEEGRYAEALEEGKKIPESDGSYYYILNLFGYARSMLGDLAGAEAELNRAFQLSKKRAETYLYMAKLRMKQKRIREALENALRARELALKEDRVEFEACELLALIYARKGRLLRAAAALRSIARMQNYGSEVQNLVYPLKGFRRQLLSETSTNPGGFASTSFLFLIGILLSMMKMALKLRADSRVFSRKAKIRLKQARNRLLDNGREIRARIFHPLQLKRLQLDRIVSRLFFPSRFRIVATACWKFPIYSQTFVYQELAHLIGKRFDLRFFYGLLDLKKYLPSQFDSLWRRRRRHIFHYKLGERDYAYFMKRIPEKVNELIRMVCEASGVAEADFRKHHNFLEGFTFARMVEAYRPDYLHSYFFYHGTLHTFFASYLLDIPRGVSCYADHMLKDYEFKMIPLHLDQCKVIIATSSRIKKELLSLAPGGNPNHILVKPNAIDSAQFSGVARVPSRSEEPHRVIAVSRIEPKKGLIYLVDAIASLRDRNVNVHAQLVGGVDNSATSKNYDTQLRERIAALNLTELIHLEGSKTHSEIKKLLKASDLFVAPFVETEYGDKDGIPTSLLEGMASGLPVIATDSGSITEVVADGVEGVLVPQRDSQALADAIGILLEDPNRARTLGTNAQKKIKEKFDIHVCEQKFHDRLDQLLTLEKNIKKHGKKEPLVSIISAFFNAGKFLKEAIESVLVQSYENWELLLIDDGSTDEGSAIARDYAARYPGKIFYLEHENHKNRGAAPSRNVGVRRAKGDYVAILDGDDVWLPHKLQRQVAVLESQPRVAMLFGPSRYWNSWTGKTEDADNDVTHDLGIEAEKLYEPSELMTLLYPLGEGGAPCPSNILLRRSMIDPNGGFEENFLGMYQLYEDQVFLTKIYLKHPVYVSSEVWDKYRLHPDSCVSRVNAAGQYDAVRKYFLDWLEKYLSQQNLKDTASWHALQRALYQYRSENDPRRKKWALRTADDNAASLLFPEEEPEVVRVEIASAPTKTSYDVQLNQPRLKVASNEDYRLHFKIRADAPRSIGVGIAKSSQPWTNLGFYKQIEIGPEWQQFEQEFLAEGDEENARIHFDLGESEIAVEIASATLSAAAAQIEPALSSLAPSLPLPDLSPVSLDWGWDRGLPIDRYYIEKFFAAHTDDFRGYVLEISDNWYTRKFGAEKTTGVEILDINDRNARATIIADLTHADNIPSNTFDCIVFPQTLQFVYDVHAAIRSLYRILKADGVLLATFPGATRTRTDDPSGLWYWSFTTASAQRLFGDIFSLENIRVGSYGNLLSAVSFLKGMASEELDTQEIDYNDPSYEVIVTVRALK